MNDVLHSMQQHASVRDYKQQSITTKELQEIITHAQCAATSNFIQAYSVISVENSHKKQQLAELTNNKHVATCGVFLVFCADLQRLNLACESQHRVLQHQLMENLLVSTIDVALFAQNVALAAESKGYGSCFIGGIRNQPDKVCELLNIPYLVYPVAGMTLGIPQSRHPTKPRLPIEAVLHQEQYQSQHYPAVLERYDVQMRQYYQHRAAHPKDTTWTAEVGQFMGNANRVHMKNFLKKQGFLAE